MITTDDPAVSSRGLDPTLTARVRAYLVEQKRPAEPMAVSDALVSCGVIAGPETTAALVRAVQDQLTGAGPLQPLLDTEGVTDVLVNGPGPVWVDDGNGLRRSNVRLRTEKDVSELARRLAVQSGSRFDDGCPFVDALLPDGVRLHAALGTVARPGTVISLRNPGRRLLTLQNLRACGMFSDFGEGLLRRLISDRISFLISGGTGSGKTTLLGAMLAVESPARRILIVEENGELRVDHPHVVSLEGRPANSEGRGRITLSDLIRQAMRMRPDRLVVGEVRGPEVRDLLTAMNTGHEGCAGTVHANAASALPQRLEALGATAELPASAIHSQLAAGLQSVVHLAQDRRGRRRLIDISAVAADDSGRVSVQQIWDFRGPKPLLRRPRHQLARLATPDGRA